MEEEPKVTQIKRSLGQAHSDENGKRFVCSGSSESEVRKHHRGFQLTIYLGSTPGIHNFGLHGN